MKISDLLEILAPLTEIFLLEVMSDHYSVSNYTSDGFEPVSKEFKEDLKEILENLPFNVIYMFKLIAGAISGVTTLIP